MYELLAPAAVTKGWLRYYEVKQVTKAKVLPDMIMQQYELLGRLHEKSPNLCFVRSKVKAAIEKIYDERHDEWGLTVEDKADYCETMCRRFMNLCRVVGQSVLKKPNAAWYHGLP